MLLLKIYNYNSSQNVLVLVQRNRKRRTLIKLYETKKDIFEIREDLFNDISRRRGTSIIIQVL